MLSTDRDRQKTRPLAGPRRSPDSQLRSGYALPSSRILRHSLILIDVLFSSCLPVSNPQQRLVSKGEVRIFETHKRDVIDKRHIARQPGACFAQPWCGHAVKHDPHLDALSLVLQPKNRCDRAGAHGPQPRKQLSASATRLASAIRSLPWQAARRTKKLPLLPGSHVTRCWRGLDSNY